MKFKLGYWMQKPGMTALHAHESARCDISEGEISVLAAVSHINGRGGVQTPMLNIRVTSPGEGVICVEAVHFAGAKKRLPQSALNAEKFGAARREGDKAILDAGALRAEISLAENDFRIDFIGARGRVTGLGEKALSHMTDGSTGKKYMTAQLDLGVGERVYGLGERFTALTKNGQTVEMWQGDGGSRSELAYKNIPFYMTSRGCGVYLDTLTDASFEVASEDVEKCRMTVEDERIRFFVFAGPTPKEVISRYTRLTGRPALPPQWSFGLWLSTSFTTNYDERTAASFIDGMISRGIPLSVFHFDCFWMKGYQWCDFTWDADMFPDPEAMLKRYREKGLKICVWINAYIAQNSPLFEECDEKGYLIKKTDGSVWQTDLWQAGMGIVDFTNPAARAWYREHLRRLMKMGVDCFKTDFDERIPARDIAYFDGSDPVAMHNYHTYLYNEAVFSVVEEERGKGNAVVFARSATTGCQKFPLHWGGDNFATYDSMAETLRGGLSLAASGFGFWSHDIGGFDSRASADLYKRWCQFGLLSSHSRLHGDSSYRVPWGYDEEAVAVLKKFTRLKCRLMPYLYRMAVIARETGVPVMRPMFMEFPEDPGCRDLDTQYMLGESLLVAPIFSPEGKVDYYLPKGKWTHLLDGRQTIGGTWMTETYDFMSLPVWVRENTLLPLGYSEESADYELSKNVELNAYNITKRVKLEIPDSKGKTAASYEAVPENGKITVKTDGAIPFTLKVWQ